MALSILRVPVVVIVTGEGGSGGALGIAIGDRILMQEFAIYSVIPPEGCAAILWRDSQRKVEAAQALKLTAPDLLSRHIIDVIVPEPATVGLLAALGLLLIGRNLLSTRRSSPRA